MKKDGGYLIKNKPLVWRGFDGLFFFFAAHVLRCDSEERLELFGEIAG